jgi:2-polyprenyl-3-methyl-5-hydroxy-6-metoxy-1,4-benzoquinol methylase
MKIKFNRKAINSVNAFDNTICPICGCKMRHISKKYYRCERCQYMLSQELPGAGAEVVGVDYVRKRNFTNICNIIKYKFPQITTILDVGCSHGIFLKIAGNEGFLTTGIEPDKETAQKTRIAGYNVLTGFFPTSEELEGKKYDAIIFNDSFEHIPNLQNIIDGIKNHLNKDGVAIINIPTSKGLVFKISSLFNKLGLHTMYDREWQTGFSSPHVHYFNEDNLELLFRNNGFEMRYTKKLLYYSINGLWDRLICKSSFFMSLVSWIVMVILYPLFVLKSDCFVSFFTVRNTS